MVSRFRIELEVGVDSDAHQTVIATARQVYAADGEAMTVDENRVARHISPDEFVGAIEQALLELVERNPLLASASIEIERLACRAAPIESNASIGLESQIGTHRSTDEVGATDGNDAQDDLEDFESGLYLCRWQNGEFSLVKADDRKEAVLQLDEWAGAEPAWLVPMETCMVDFRLNDRGEIELNEFGEETAEFIWDTCYPELDQVLSSEDALKHPNDKRSQKAAGKIRKAVEHERKRLWNAPCNPTQAKTALGRELQNRLGTAGPVADRYVEIAANEILLAKGGNGKPN
jgi:hypothetical protein